MPGRPARLKPHPGDADTLELWIVQVHDRGLNAKAKRIARQMRGRAGFTLLRHRVLLA
ncbi:hypothetical protein ACFQ2K_05250 [Streptomyces sanglieri]|uniref:Transposase n=1 Tax=Streptomyces sanglieri TaxID=193460 RepID=A0ABW2WLM3_9ACTN